MKPMRAVLAVATVVLGLTACSSSGEPTTAPTVTVTTTVAKPAVTVTRKAAQPRHSTAPTPEPRTVTVTREAEPEPVNDDAIMDLALEMAWEQQSAEDQAAACSAFQIFGPAWATEQMNAELNPADHYSEATVDRFFTKVC